MRGLTPRERAVLRIMALPPLPEAIDVPDIETELALRALTEQGRVHNWLVEQQDGTHERWTISQQGRDALRLVPGTEVVT